MLPTQVYQGLPTISELLGGPPLPFGGGTFAMLISFLKIRYEIDNALDQSVAPPIQ